MPELISVPNSGSFEFKENTNSQIEYANKKKYLKKAKRSTLNSDLKKLPFLCLFKFSTWEKKYCQSAFFALILLVWCKTGVNPMKKNST
jgi:hypothetical protein